MQKPHHSLSFLCLLILCATASAQNPFGAVGTASKEATTESDSAQPEGPLVKQLMEHSRRGNLQLGEAISSLARIRNWTRVEQLLAEVNGKQIAPATLAEMQKKIGPAIFLRIKQANLNDAAKAGLQKMATASVAQAESPDRLRKAIAGLGSDNVDTKLGAARTLLAGGNAAIKELVTVAVTEDPKVDRDLLLQTMLRIGPGGSKALSQLALYGTPNVRHQALRALARINRSEYVPELLTGLHGRDSIEEEVATATNHLALLGDVPNRAAAIATLALDLEHQSQRAQLINNDEQVVTLWNITEDRQSVTYQDTRAVYAAFREVADASARLRRVGNLSMDLACKVISGDMAYRVMIDPGWGDQNQIDDVRETYSEFQIASLISAGIDHSMAVGDHPATIGLIRLVDPRAGVLEQNLLLQSSNAKPTPLAQAARSAEPQVRYEAALAATRLADGMPYAGSSRVTHCLREMQGLSEKPTAILVETRPNFVTQQELILGSMGFQVVVVPSVASLQRCVDRGGDLRLILSKTELADLPAVEMVDMVRRIDRGRELPIVFYGSEPLGLNEGRWDAPMIWIDRPASPAAFDDLLDQRRLRRRLDVLSPIDRSGFRDQATDLLTQRS